LCVQNLHTFSLHFNVCLRVHACEVPLITGDVFSMATKSKTGTKPKLLSIQEKVDMVNTVYAA